MRCALALTRACAVDVLGKPATYFIHPDDHAALGALCADAVASVTSKLHVRLRHRTTAEGVYVPMECRASFDGEFIFLVRRRARRVPQRRRAGNGPKACASWRGSCC
jgi:hypothetical protein